MRTTYDTVRQWWRRFKESEPWNRNCCVRFAYSCLRTCAGFVKRHCRGTDLEALALYLHYHPEMGVAPRDAWKARQKVEIFEDELAELRQRLIRDRADVCRRLNIVECGLDGVAALESPPEGGIAVHVHVFYPDRLGMIADSLANIPFMFDLYVSAPESVDIDEDDVRKSMDGVSHVGKMAFKRCANRGRDIAPLVCLFGSELSRYRYIAHFHTKKSPHDVHGRGWLEFAMKRLVGSEETCRRIFGMLAGDFGMVTHVDFVPMPEDPSGWGENMDLAKEVVARSGMSLDFESEFPVVVFPQGSMFWARRDFLSRLFDLRLAFEDFPEEPVGADGTLAHALERLFYFWGVGKGLKVARIR